MTKENEVLTHATSKNLENSVLSGRSQPQKTIYDPLKRSVQRGKSRQKMDPRRPRLGGRTKLRVVVSDC